MYLDQTEVESFHDSSLWLRSRYGGGSVKADSPLLESITIKYKFDAPQDVKEIITD